MTFPSISRYLTVNLFQVILSSWTWKGLYTWEAWALRRTPWPCRPLCGPEPYARVSWAACETSSSTATPSTSPTTLASRTQVNMNLFQSIRNTLVSAYSDVEKELLTLLEDKKETAESVCLFIELTF